MIADLIDFIIFKHKGQKDKQGQDYVFHLINVAFNVSQYCIPIALLHDIFEDTDATEQDLKKLLVDDIQITAIKLLTRNKKQDYFDYIETVKTNEMAKEVKIADLQHNLSKNRPINEILRHRYEKALYILEDKEEIENE